MIFEFNNDIDIIYMLDYFIKKEENKLLIYNPKTICIDIKELYNLYKNFINEEEKKKVTKIGDYHYKEEYVLNNGISFIKNYEKFYNYFNKLKTRNDIKKDILQNKYLPLLDIEFLEKFYHEKLKNKIHIIITPFVSGGFGTKHENKFYIILGVKFNEEKQKFTSCGTLVPKIIHELTHPIIHNKIDKYVLNYQKDMLFLDCYDNNQIEELIVRVLEIFLSSKFLGNEYFKWAIEEQTKVNFLNISKIFTTIEDDLNSIKDIDNFFEILLKHKIILKK